MRGNCYTQRAILFWRNVLKITNFHSLGKLIFMANILNYHLITALIIEVHKICILGYSWYYLPHVNYVHCLEKKVWPFVSAHHRNIFKEQKSLEWMIGPFPMNIRVCIVTINVMFSGSSSRCRGLVCSMWLWYFFIILSYFLVFILSKLNLNWIILLRLYDQTVRYESIKRSCSISSPNLTTCEIYRQRRNMYVD